MKKLGIIGGLGPMATAYFLQLLTQMSDAGTDQEHIEVYMVSRPSIPDRTAYLLGESEESPLPEMAEAGKQLRRMGAELLVMPCVTGHYFHKEIERSAGIPMVDAIEETAAYLQERNIRRAAILATDGTIKSGLFQRAIERRGMECFIPDAAGQKEIMDIIYRDIKAGKPVHMRDFEMVSGTLRLQGAEVILLACTELSLLKRDYQIGKGYLDVMEVLAAKTVSVCNKLKPEYRELFM